MFKDGDKVFYFDHNVDRYVKATIVGRSEKNGSTIYDCDVEPGERPELPDWIGNGQWGYEDQFIIR